MCSHMPKFKNKPRNRLVRRADTQAHWIVSSLKRSCLIFIWSNCQNCEKFVSHWINSSRESIEIQLKIVAKNNGIAKGKCHRQRIGIDVKIENA